LAVDGLILSVRFKHHANSATIPGGRHPHGSHLDLIDFPLKTKTRRILWFKFSAIDSEDDARVKK
jgi:hypothetical protein